MGYMSSYQIDLFMVCFGGTIVCKSSLLVNRHCLAVSSLLHGATLVKKYMCLNGSYNHLLTKFILLDVNLFSFRSYIYI